MEAVESVRAGLSPIKGDVRKKRRRPRKVVCCHKKGTCERRKEEDQGRWSVTTRRGREKEEKKKTKEGKKVALRRQDSVCPEPRISFSENSQNVVTWRLRLFIWYH